MTEQADPFLEELVHDVIRIAQLAGESIMHYYADVPTHPEFLQHKADSSPITEADRVSNRIIVEELKAMKEKYPILSEEESMIPFEERSRFRRIWIVDPLDGTKEFINKTDEFAVHIGLSDFGKAVLGVVYIPATQTTYYAVRRGGAFKEVSGLITPLQVNPLDIKAEGVKVVHSRSHMNKPTQVYINSLNKPVTVPMGSSLKMMKIAEGEFDIYPKFGSKMQEWDTCAPQIILEEAGGIMVCVEKGKPLTYNKEDLTQPDFYAMGHLTSYYEY